VWHWGETVGIYKCINIYVYNIYNKYKMYNIIHIYKYNIVYKYQQINVSIEVASNMQRALK
jgi:hypothetical protein